MMNPNLKDFEEFLAGPVTAEKRQEQIRLEKRDDRRAKVFGGVLLVGVVILFAVVFWLGWTVGYHQALHLAR